MKNFPLFTLILILIPYFSFGDSRIILKSHTDAYYYGGINNPATDSISEIWIGKNKMAYITSNRKIVVDTDKKSVFLIYKNNKIFAETTLPVNLSSLVPENIAIYLQGIKSLGTVKKTGKNKKINNYECTAYEINSYINYQGEKVNESDTIVWIAGQVSFDIKKYNELNNELRKIRNYNDKLISDMEKMEGFPMMSETYFYPKGFSVRSISEVASITEEEPPTGCYSVPGGFNKKKKLSVRDLRTR